MSQPPFAATLSASCSKVPIEASETALRDSFSIEDLMKMIELLHWNAEPYKCDQRTDEALWEEFRREHDKQRYSSLIWCDLSCSFLVNIDDPNLRFVTKDIQILNTVDKCISYVEDHPSDRVLLLIEGPGSKELIEKIHDLAQISKIHFVTQTDDKVWASQYPKVQSSSNSLSSKMSTIVRDQARLFQQNGDHSFVSMTFYCPLDDVALDQTHKNLSMENGDFLYGQLFIEVLKRLNDDEIHSSLHEFVQFSKKIETNNQSELITFEHNYKEENVLKYYTQKSFVYGPMNEALRRQDWSRLIIMRFLIRDIYMRLCELQLKVEGTTHVYRGQALTRAELQRMKDNTGNLTAMNSFLSTSRHRDVALMMAQSNAERRNGTDLELVLFDIEMNINHDQNPNMAPYADIKNFSSFSAEVEVLFMLGSVFKLTDVMFNEPDGVWVISLHLTCTNSPLLAYMKEELPLRTSLTYMANVLYDMGQYDRAEQLLLELVSQDDNNVPLYDQLVVVKLAKNDYTSAFEYIKKGSQRRMKIPTCSDLYKSYKLFGTVYKSVKDYESALDHFSIALGLLQSNTKADVLAIADVHLEIGLLHMKAEDFRSALSSFNHSLQLKQDAHGECDPEIARILTSLGAIANHQDEYEQALNYLFKALDIQRKKLPSDHYDVAQTYHHIGLVYAQLGKQDLCMKYAHRSFTIELNLLPLVHPSRAELIEAAEDIRSLESLWTMSDSLCKISISEQLETLINGSN